MNIMKPMALVSGKSPVLIKVALEVPKITDEILTIGRRMNSTAAVSRGLAVAAPQVGRSIRVVSTPSLTYVNPEILERSDEVELDVEGCLSFPGRFFEVERSTGVLLRYLTTDEEVCEIEVLGLQARMWQHEIDHLNGVILKGLYPEVRNPR